MKGPQLAIVTTLVLRITLVGPAGFGGFTISGTGTGKAAEVYQTQAQQPASGSSDSNSSARARAGVSVGVINLAKHSIIKTCTSDLSRFITSRFV